MCRFPMESYRPEQWLVVSMSYNGLYRSGVESGAHSSYLPHFLVVAL